MRCPLHRSRAIPAVCAALLLAGALAGCHASMDARAAAPVTWPVEPRRVPLPVGDGASIAAIETHDPLAQPALQDPDLPGGPASIDEPSIETAPVDLPPAVSEPVADAGIGDPDGPWLPDPGRPVDPMPPDPGPPQPAAVPGALPAGELPHVPTPDAPLPDCDIPSPGAPPPPPPPTWDPARDRVRRLGTDGRPIGGASASEYGTGGSPAPAAPGPGDALPPPADPRPPAGDPWIPGTAPSETPPAAAPPAGDPWLPGTAPSETRPAASPPAGAPTATPPSSPWLSDQPATRPAVPGDPPPAEDPNDPGLPPGGALPPAPWREPKPAPTPAPPPADDPRLPGGTPATPPSPAPVDDPWLPGGGTQAPPAVPDPAPPAAPAPADDPWLPGGGTSPSAPPSGDDPWLPATQPGTEKPPTPGHRTTLMEHVTQLRDAPGDPKIRGYPEHLVPSAQPGMALTPGGKPAVVVFYDDARRESDLLAAEVLPVLARYRDRIDFVAIDRARGAAVLPGATALTETYLGGVPTLVVLDRARKTELYNKTGDLTARRLDAALNEVTRPAARPPDPEPFTPPEDPQPPADPTPPEPDPADPPARDPGMSFTPPLGYTAKQHVDRLRASPGNPRVPGYPSDIVPSAPAERVLTSGHRPIVLIFFDDTSKASDLQAADFLPVLLKRKDEVDLVFVDMNASASWDKSEKTVVRTYYNFYVPTTVVLAANRAPVKSWFSRIKALDLDRAIDEALLR